MNDQINVTLQSQLTQAHKERDEKKSELAELWSKTETIINDRTKALLQERDEAVAACAVMREALTQYRVALERCVGALEGLLVHAVEFRNDWVKGDFELGELAQCDMKSMIAKFKAASDALALATPLIEKGRKK